MWKASLALIGHRFLLFLTAFIVINASIPSTTSGVLPQIHSTRDILSRFMERVAEGPEFAALDKTMSARPGEVFSLSSDPFIWISRWVAGVTGLSPRATLLILSNLIVLLFLSELVALLSRMVPMDVAESAAILLVLWPTSYELSLGSSWALTCCLATIVVREAMDNRWLIGGIAMGLLILQHPLALGLVPLSVYLFWYFQRHFMLFQIVKRACFFLIPFGIALYFRWSQYPSFGEIFSQSALLNVFEVMKTAGSGAGWTVSQSYAGQTVAIIFFGVGAGFSALSNSGLLHRIIPLTMFLILLLFSPYAAIASRAPLAATCLEGVAAASSPIVTRIVQVLLLLLSMYEVALVFARS